jgi:hypothetical protein
VTLTINQVRIVYQDALTRRWAEQVLDRMAGVVGPEALPSGL